MSPNTRAVAAMGKFISSFRGLSILRTAAGSLGLKVGAAGLGFINGILLARILGPAEFGVYSIAMSVVNVGATLAVMGLPMLATREVAAKAEHGQWSKLKGIINSAHGWTLLSTLLIWLVSIVLITIGALETDVTWPVIVIGLLLILLLAINQLRAAILRGLHWVILADIPELFLRPFAMFLLLLGAFLFATHIDSGQALIMQFAAACLSLIVGTWWLFSLQPPQLKSATSDQPDRAWIFQALPFLGVAVVSIMDGQVSLYMLGYISGAEQAGLFFAAYQLVNLIAIGLLAVNMPLQPRLAAAWVREDKVHAQTLLTEAARLGTGIGLIGVLVMMIFPEYILALYGGQYADASVALRILAIGQLINAVAGSCGILLMMTGHQSIVMQGTVGALLVNVGCAYLAIPHYGILGGALATALGVALWNVYFSLYSWRNLGLNTTIFFRGKTA